MTQITQLEKQMDSILKQTRSRKVIASQFNVESLFLKEKYRIQKDQLAGAIDQCHHFFFIEVETC